MGETAGELVSARADTKAGTSSGLPHSWRGVIAGVPAVRWASKWAVSCAQAVVRKGSVRLVRRSVGGVCTWVRHKYICLLDFYTMWPRTGRVSRAGMCAKPSSRG